MMRKPTRKSFAVILAGSLMLASPAYSEPVTITTGIVIGIKKGLAWWGAKAAQKEAARRTAAAAAQRAAVDRARQEAARQAALVAQRQAAANTARLSSQPRSFVLGDSLKNAAVQEAVSQATRFAIKSAVKAPITPTLNRTVIVQSQRVSPEAKKWITLNGGATFTGGAILSAPLWTTMANAYSLEEAPVTYYQKAFEADIRAGIELGETEMYLKFCALSEGVYYGLPLAGEVCMDGSPPVTTEQPMDLSAFQNM